ncbi:MAG: hypothetical protein AAF916_12720 [Planctomycetota bacterium]
MEQGKVHPEPSVSSVQPADTTLHYTHLRPAKTRAQQLRIAAKSVAIAGVVAGVFSVGVFSGKLTRQHASSLFGPGAAVAANELAPGTVVYEELPTAARALLGDGRYINPLAGQAPIAIHNAGPTRDTYQLLTRAETVNSPSDHGAQTLLAHVETATGQTRIVSVRYIPAGSKARVAGFLIETFDLSGFLARPQRVYQSFVADVVGVLPDEQQAGPRDFRLFAGEVDADEAGHFTIPYEVGDRRGVIDGYLRPDGRTVDLEVRDQAIQRMIDTNPVHMRVDDRRPVGMP